MSGGAADSAGPAGELVDLELPLAPPHFAPAGYAVGAPPAFSSIHDETGRVVVTNWEIGPTLIGDFDFERDARIFGMGHTQLFVTEKRALIVDGRLVRRWPPAFAIERSDRRDGSWAAIVPTTMWSGVRKHRYEFAAATTSTADEAVTWALELSTAAHAPVLLVRQLLERFWH